MDWLEEDLARLGADGLLRRPRVLASGPAPFVEVDGREALLLCSNDYLGLSGHPALRQAAIRAIERHGVGACSSRLVSGTQAAHRRLEARLSAWLGQPDVRLLPAGFMANLAVLSLLAGRGDVVFSDELNHASIVQGCRLSRAEIVVYPHRDVAALAARMAERRPRARRAVVVTDSVFSVDGDLAPLAELAALSAGNDAALVVDEAHALGVLGPRGRGLAAALGARPDVVVGTLGKAFGVAGAFVAGPVGLGALLDSRAVPHIYTTAQPPALAAAAEAALGLVEEADEARARVAALAARLRAGIQASGLSTGPGESHIVPAMLPGARRVVEASSRLLEKGVFVQALRPPTVRPGTERLRWTATAAHSEEQVDLALERLGETLAELGPAPDGAEEAPRRTR